MQFAVTLGLTAVSSGAGTLAFLAQAAPQATDLAPYVGGGAGVIAVTALAEVCRRLLNGRLIPRETRDAENEVAAYALAAGQREDRAMKVVEDANVLVKRTAETLREANARLALDVAETTKRTADHLEQQMTHLARVVEDLRDEIREDRRGR